MSVIRLLKEYSPLVAYFAFFLSLFVGICGYHYKEITLQNEYLTSAQANRPRLVPLDSLSLSMVDFLIDSVTSVDGIPGVWCHLQIGAKMLFYNAGNVEARLVGQAWRDTLTGRPVWRDCLLDEGRRNNLCLSPDMSFFKVIEVQPGETTELRFDRPIYGLDPDSGACFHVIVLYKNPAGALYDTYYMVRLKTKGYGQLFARVPLSAKATHVPTELKPQICELVKHSVTTHIYGKEARDDIVEWIVSNWREAEM